MTTLIFLSALAFDPAPDNFIRGDVNHNGSVTSADGDMLYAYLYSGGAEPTCEDAMDANDSGAIDLSDCIYIWSFYYNGGSAPPAPYPSCGGDPTSDFLLCDCNCSECW